jgi:hypothetical protein
MTNLNKNKMTELRIKLKKILTDLEYSHDYLFTHDEIPNIIDKIEEAISVTRCCETVKDKYTHTFEVDLNSVKRQEQYNKQIEQIHNAPCKTYIFDGEKYIELKP